MYKPEDHIQQLADHIKSNLKKGYTQDALKYSLMEQGYSKISVENAIERANQQLAESIPTIREKPRITYRVIKNEEPVEVNESKEKKSFFQRLFG
jgi:hypothetical protein